MTPAEKVLDRLDGVLDRGNGQFLARCPSHEDKSPSLSIKDESDRVLVHCFAGCEALDVVESIGLELSDLFEQPPAFNTGKKPRFNPRDVLLALRHETTVVMLAVGDLRDGHEVDVDRIALAHQRISQAMELANVR